MVFGGTMPKEQGPFMTPRSLVKFSKIYDAFADEERQLPHW